MRSLTPNLMPDRETVLPVTGRAAAGHPLGRSARRDEAIRIFTGAPMPDGTDTVMMQEDCAVENQRVRLRPAIKKGANRRHAPLPQSREKIRGDPQNRPSDRR